MVPILDCILLGVLVMGNFLLGMYFSLRKKSLRIESASVKLEMFLGSRVLKILPLAASSVASLVSSTGLVGFTGHYYAFGWHLTWAYLGPFLCLPMVTHVFIPVLYRLRITSVFEYIRLRFSAAISLTTCAIYIFLTQSIGAIAISAASLTLFTVFSAPPIWCNILIGLSGTIYTALGGLRGVVWTDCVQFIFIVIAPIAVVVKVILDSRSPTSQATTLSDIDLRKYVFDFRFDFTSNENVPACLFATLAGSMFRSCLDQMVAQRLLASRTLEEAKRTAVTSAFLLLLVYVMPFFMTLALTVWFRGCDPTLLGEIKNVDQILPYYVRTYLLEIPGLVGLFLAGIVSAATSTVSSAINSQAAILYVDVISPRYKNSEVHVLWITRGIALILGVTMTIYSTMCIYLGPITRLLLMVNTGLTAPFVGLCILALLFPFVHSKGAGLATLITVVYQLSHTGNSIVRGKSPPKMPASLDHCPRNLSLTTAYLNDTLHQSETVSSNESFFLYRLSFLWSSLFSILATVLLGIVISLLTGETHKEEQPELCSDALVRIWRGKRTSRIETQPEMADTRPIHCDMQNGKDGKGILFAPIPETDV